MHVSWLRIGCLAVFFFLLSVKGEQNISQLQDWETINLPEFALWIKHSANQFGVVMLGVLACLSLRRRISPGISLPAIAQVAILVWYFLRSATVGSENPLNYAAIATLGTWLYVVSDNPNKPHGEEFEKALLYFSVIHTTATLWLALSGFGYAAGGAANRLYGLAYHPNMLGAVSSISFSVLVFNSFSEKNELRPIRGRFLSVLAVFAIVPVILSGSRTALLMSLVPIAFALPLRVLIAFTIIAAALMLSGGLILIVAPETPWGAAIARMLDAPLDNRRGVWEALIKDFNAYPVLGAGDRAGVSASSYLTAFSGTGIFGGFLFSIVMLISALTSIRRLVAFRLKKSSGLKTSLYELIFLQIAVGSLFEAYMFDKFGLLQLLAILTFNRISKKVKI